MYQLMKHSAVGVACLCTASAAAAPNVKEGSAPAAKQAPAHATRVVSYAAASGAIESLFLREDLGASGERLTGLTRLAEGTRVWEEAHFDHAGRLVRAESVCSVRSGDSVTVTFDPTAGVVETRSAEGFHRWSVPTDHPWAWLPSSCVDVTTPVAVTVAARASKHHDALRVIDTHRFTSYSVMIDQVVVPEDARADWVVLNDDAVLVKEGIPVRWHANALDVNVEQR